LLNLVATPIGNLDDISKRAFLALENAEVIFAEDTRIAKKLLNLLNIPLNKKFISLHSHNEKKVIQNLNPDLLNSKNCVYISDAGMPAISDPGAELVKFCQENNIKYSVIPGPSAFVLAFAASGFEGEFTFFGFLPHKGNEREKKLNEVINNDKISILYESPHRIEKLLKELKTKIPQRTIFLAKELTKIHETFIKAKAKDIQLTNTKGEWVVIIDKGEKKQKTISSEDILSLEIPPKIKAKILSKISGEKTKDIYNKLIQK